MLNTFTYTYWSFGYPLLWSAYHVCFSYLLLLKPTTVYYFSQLYGLTGKLLSWFCLGSFLQLHTTGGWGGSLLGWKAQDGLTYLSVNWCCLWLGHLGFLPCDLSFSTKLVQLLYMTVSGHCSKKEKWKLQDLLRPSLGSYITYFPYIILWM